MKKHLIIVDGVDGTGKSTLVKHIIDTLEFKLLDHQIEPRQNINEIPLFIDAIEKSFAEGDKFIMDRGPLTEFVYSTALERETKSDWRAFVNLLKEYNPIYIHCHNSDAYKLSMERGEDYVTDENNSLLIARTYRDFFEDISRFVTVIKFNFTEDEDYSSVVSKLNCILK